MSKSNVGTGRWGLIVAAILVASPTPRPVDKPASPAAVTALAQRMDPSKLQDPSSDKL